MNHALIVQFAAVYARAFAESVYTRRVLFIGVKQKRGTPAVRRKSALRTPPCAVTNGLLFEGTGGGGSPRF